jgi:hypothetical protein
MSRSRWKVPLQCRRCFETGEAILSHQHDGPADIQVEFIAPGFRVIANPSQDVREGVSAFFAKREPAFKGR